MTVTRMKLSRFTAFEELDFEPSPGVNLLVGANETGKTHLMKAAYAACDVSKPASEIGFVKKLVRVFLPWNGAPGRLVKRRDKSSHCEISVHRETSRLKAVFSNHVTAAAHANVSGIREWKKHPAASVYIPVKEMLVNAPGFGALYRGREIHFEEIYADIIDRASLPLLRGASLSQRNLVKILEESLTGRIELEGETFFHKSRRGKIEFTLLAEGMRKIGLLWLLVKNGALLPESSAPRDSVLFWDEPEANPNPGLFGPAVEFLLELQRQGAQIFVASHSYGILKSFDLRKKEGDNVAFHSLYRSGKDDEIQLRTVDSYLAVEPNAIAEAFDDLYDREIERSIRGVRR